MKSVYSDVEQYTEKYSAIWANISTDISYLKEYTAREKKYIKKQIEQSLNAFIEQIKKANSEENSQWKSELKSILKQRAKAFLNIDNPELENIMVSSFTDVAENFIDSAREFDKSMDMKDIAQAIRNVWIMNTIQVIADKEVQLTPSIFAYSMIYPYTDNYLDDPNISKEHKVSFNQRLEQRLKGQNVAATDSNEEKIYALLSMIENEYPRDKYPYIFESILCIHTGQCKSLNQQKKSSNPSPKDILTISVEKGGTSVLADAYLVCDSLDSELSDLMFGFGFILQLIDDLQDAKEDYENNHMTVFSQILNSERLDNITSKLINFTLHGLDFDSYQNSPYTADIKKLIIDNTLLLVFESIWENRRYYTKGFIKKYKKFSPFDYQYINKKMQKTKKDAGKLEHLI